MLDTEPLLKSTDFPAIYRSSLNILQVNLGYLCNLSCTHCHVNAGPKRTELAEEKTIESILAFMRAKNIQILDVTGGAPEMNPHFRYLVEQSRAMSVEVIDRCNLTILNEPGYEWLVDFLAEHGVSVVASLPCYEAKNVSEQRGKGVFESSILGIKKLNSAGYARSPHLNLKLVYNPNGAFLPPDQKSLENTYKEKLLQDHGIFFDELLTITNMPISRFGSMLLSKDTYHQYMNLLKDNYDADNLEGLMCRNLISVDWQGYIYDCDFNQMLGWPLRASQKLIASDRTKLHLDDLLHQDLEGNPIVIGEHCYGCTAGQGSSCSGALN